MYVSRFCWSHVACSISVPSHDEILQCVKVFGSRSFTCCGKHREPLLIKFVLLIFVCCFLQLCLGGVLCVPLLCEVQQQHRGLISALAPHFFASFSLHLSTLTDLLSQAFLKDVFAPANPPHALHSEKAIDGWCCIYGVVEAALDSSLPIRW